MNRVLAPLLAAPCGGALAQGAACPGKPSRCE